MRKIRQAAPTADIVHVLLFGGLITFVGFLAYVRV